MAQISFSRSWWLGLWGVLGACAVQAATISHVIPQGASTNVRQVVVQISADAVPLGNPQAAAPAQVQCDPRAQGSGRWNNAREWVWEFDAPPPAGTRCTVERDKSFKLPSGAALQGAGTYQFFVSGPELLRSWPSRYSTILEDQEFVLKLNGEPTKESLEQHVYCQVDGVGERIPVQVLDTTRTQVLLEALGIDEKKGHYVALQCKRRLTAGADVKLVYGPGVAMANGVHYGSTETLYFDVRKKFTAQMRCERERANAGCLPVREVQLSFSTDVPKDQAAQVYLQHKGKKIAPDLSKEHSDTVSELRFLPPFVESGEYQIVIPPNLEDDMQRRLSNADAFPLQFKMGEAPTLFKFAASPFGVLERFAENDEGTAVLPVTVRKVEAMDGRQTTKDVDAQLRTLRLNQDADIIRWWDTVQRYDNHWVSRERARGDVLTALPPQLGKDDYSVETRTLSLLKDRAGVQNLQLPKAQAQDPRPFEVVGIPLNAPGFYVVEAESPRLGQALLDEGYGSPRSMFVRTSALVTNLAVHLKVGGQGSAVVWVTSLDKGQPVEGAKVQVSDCRGRVHASGTTGADGVLLLPDLEEDVPQCDSHDGSGQWFVSARHSANDVQDMAFVWSDWQRGIEPWRFNLPGRSWWDSGDDLVAHTVFDRNLVRAGETVSMKHFVRKEVLQGLTLPERWPAEMRITHVGSGQQYKQRLQWSDTRNGGRNATSSFAVPAAAKLGQYTVELLWPTNRDGDSLVIESGSFRVEEFRLPVFQGDVQPVGSGTLIAPQQLDVDVHLSFLNGGAASGAPVKVSALLSAKNVAFERWAGYSFRAPHVPAQVDRDGDGGGARLIADKLPLTLDKQGQGQVKLQPFPAVTTPQVLRLEANFSDPNGEIQTLSSTRSVWPAAVVAGVRTERWMSVGRKMQMQALAVDTAGNPQAHIALKVEAVLHSTTTTRKRLVGGFYSYDNQYSRKSLGQVCSGKSDASGLLSCNLSLLESGEVELIVSAQDSQGRTSQAAATVWVSGQGELWFGGQDHDRMDVLAEKPSYAPGDIAKLQVRMPFREATALVSVEREGVLQTQVVKLDGKDPTIELKVQPGWGPNVYVSVLALRGRLHEVPWYSFFTWGYKAPSQWWNAYWSGGKEYVAPTAMVDLSKPSFRFGVAELKVQDPSHLLQVRVQADKPRYQIRDKAKVTIRATLPDGKPAAHAEVAVAAVDKALLELSPNTSWNLRDAMWQRRAWDVATATAQMEVVGRRHYGRKAAAPGGGGGNGAPTRQLLDTLLLWQPRVQLDAQGQAEVEVPLNDALTSFTIVAVADDGVQRFGTGSVDIATTQDLQLISGLPPVVREGDKFQAMLTLRNSTDAPMRVQLQPQAQGVTLAAQTVELPAQASKGVNWEVTVPVLLEQSTQVQWPWQLNAKDEISGAQDSLALNLQVLTAVPLAVQQSTLLQLDGDWTQALEWPKQALPRQGGVRLTFNDKLADPVQGVPGLREWWMAYPYSCLEQTVGKAIGRGDATLWQKTMSALPTYLDDDGLAMYFPPQDGREARGSDTLTAYLLSIDPILRSVDPRFQLPEAERERMEAGLIAMVEGRIARDFWSPLEDMDIRKIAAIAALAESGKARPAMLESIRIEPQTWPTHTVMDWMRILQKMPYLPGQAERLEAAQQLLKSRLYYNGAQVSFRTDGDDNWWWLMQGSNVNVARLLLLTMEDETWDAERVRLVTGLLARQKRGNWQTTVANTWAGLALRQFSQRYERDAVSGSTTAVMGSDTQTVQWSQVAAASTPSAPTSRRGFPQPVDALRSMFLPRGDAPTASLSVQHSGTGKPWMAFQSIAAVPRTEAVKAGYAIRKTVSKVQHSGAASKDWKRGDVVRVRLELDAHAPMTWVVINDPIPAGATILGSGLGRDSAIAVQEEGRAKGAWPAFVERAQDGYRAYWEYLPEGAAVVEYTMRLNNEGDFALPPTRAEALYAPEMFGELPNPRWKVQEE